MTKIAWTDESWNPITGCTKVSRGCQNCYAERMAKRLAGRFGYSKDEPFGVTFHPDRLGQPLRWRKPRRIFVCSMGDLFHEHVPYNWAETVFETMYQSPQHVYQVLTKRPERMVIFVRKMMYPGLRAEKMLANIWLGTSVEDQDTADRRISHLLNAPAAVRFLSVEPMLGPIDLAGVLDDAKGHLHWVIVGCESGPGARPCKRDWIQDIVDTCAGRVPVFVKQLLVARRGVSHDPDEWPADLRRREFPVMNHGR